MKNSYTNFVNNQVSKKQITIQGVKDHNYLYSGWEINRVNESINNLYYKNEIINTLKDLLQNEISPKDIMIFDKSFSVEKQYYQVKTGKVNLLSSEIKQLYFMGRPFALQPSKQTILMNLCFQAYREVFSICNTNSINIPEKGSTLQNLYKKSKSNRIESLIDYMISEVKKCNQLAAPKKLETINKSIEEHLQSIEKDYKYISKINLKDSEFLKDDKIKKYDSFEYFFNQLDRPIVVVKQGNRTQIICHDFIIKSKYNSTNPRFLETNKISQNSPLILILSLSITFLPRLSLAIKRRLALRADKLRQIAEMEPIDDETRDIQANLEREFQALNYQAVNIDSQVEQQGYKEITLDSNNCTKEMKPYIEKIDKITESEISKIADLMEVENIELTRVEDKDDYSIHVDNKVKLDIAIKKLAENLSAENISEVLNLPIEMVNEILGI